MSWINLDERQPDEYQSVIWYCVGGRMLIGMYFGKGHCDQMPEKHPMHGKSREHYGRFGCYAEPAGDGYRATHWMPLPDAPGAARAAGVASLDPQLNGLAAPQDAPQFAPQPRSQVISIATTAKMLTVSKATVYNYIKNGCLPAPLRLGPRRVGYRLADIEDWLALREGGVA